VAAGPTAGLLAPGFAVYVAYTLIGKFANVLALESTTSQYAVPVPLVREIATQPPASGHVVVVAAAYPPESLVTAMILSVLVAASVTTAVTSSETPLGTFAKTALNRVPKLGRPAIFRPFVLGKSGL
jgi:hypothetical protein